MINFFLLSHRQNTRWGASNTPFARWLPAEYQDNIAQAIGWDPEKKINGHILPLVTYFNISSLLAALQMAEKDTWFAPILLDTKVFIVCILSAGKRSVQQNSENSKL